MKILCLCARGNSRSVALAWILKDHMGQEAIATGVEIMSEETRDMLFSWAERIILVDKTFEDRIPDEFKNKLKIWDVGPDRFFRGFEQDLLEMYTNYINSEGL